MIKLEMKNQKKNKMHHAHVTRLFIFRILHKNWKKGRCKKA